MRDPEAFWTSLKIIYVIFKYSETFSMLTKFTYWWVKFHRNYILLYPNPKWNFLVYYVKIINFLFIGMNIIGPCACKLAKKNPVVSPGVIVRSHILEAPKATSAPFSLTEYILLLEYLLFSFSFFSSVIVRQHIIQKLLAIRSSVTCQSTRCGKVDKFFRIKVILMWIKKRAL